MKKKFILKDWVAYSILMINVILAIFICGECEDIKMFFISKTIMFAILIMNHLIIKKHTNLMEN